MKVFQNLVNTTFPSFNMNFNSSLYSEKKFCDFFSLFAACCGQGDEPIAEPGSRNLQNARQTRATDEATGATFDPQQTAHPLVSVVPCSYPRPAGQGEAVDVTIMVDNLFSCTLGVA